MKLRIYTVGHKALPENFTLPDNYYYFKVGAKDCKADFYDDSEINIHEKNPYYCELTAYYWIWKNDKDSDVVGLAHYRRYFSKSYFFNPKNFYNTKQIEKDLRNHDIITTKLYKIYGNCFTNRVEFCHEEDVKKLRESMKRIHPDYLKTYDEVMAGNRTFLLNMFIAKKEVFDNYAKWLFDLFDDLEKYIHPENYEGNYKRVFGYLSETLLTVYVFHNHLKYKCVRVNVTDKTFWQRVRNKLRKIILRKNQ